MSLLSILAWLRANKRPSAWVGGVVIALAALWFSRCSGERTAHADDAIKSADAAAKASQQVTDTVDKIRKADDARLVALIAVADSATKTAQQQTANALASLGRISVVGPATRLAETPVTGAADEPPDTTKYAAIQRQGDARVYTVPQFVVDLGVELRKAIAASQSDATAARAALTASLRVIGDDSTGIRSRDATIVDLRAAERVAKSNAGRDCRLVPFVPCPPRKVVAAVALVVGVAGGYALEKR